MAYKPKPWVDKVWLGWFVMQLLVIFLVDAVQFYPKSWYAAEGSPLHALQRLHDFYIDTYNDPIAQWDLPGRPWVRLFSYIEMGLQLPVALYGVYLLGGFKASSSSSPSPSSKKGTAASTTSYSDELLFFVYALETAFTTLVCVHDVFYWDGAVYSAEQKRVFWFQLYGPWLLMPCIMASDMALRLQSRLAASVDQTERKME